jgi:transcriptional regulator with XRE-family HTH domain
MGDPVTGPGGGPAISRQRLGTRLRQHREARGLQLADAAAALDVAPSTVSRIETGGAPARTSYVRLMLDLYQVTDPGERRQLADLAREGQRDDYRKDQLPPGAARYLGLEDSAGRVRVYATQVIPALLQTPGYARAAARAMVPGQDRAQGRALAEITASRRQHPGREPLPLHAVIDESALLRQLASPQVMASQLEHLATQAAAPQVTLQVLPLAAVPPVLTSSFTLLELAGTPDVACATSHAGQHHLTTREAAVTALHAAFAALARAALAPEDCDIPELDIGGGRTLGWLQRIDIFGQQSEDNIYKLTATVLRILGRHW